MGTPVGRGRGWAQEIIACPPFPLDLGPRHPLLWTNQLLRFSTFNSAISSSSCMQGEMGIMNASTVMMPKTLPLRDKFRRLIEYSVPAEEEGTLRGEFCTCGANKITSTADSDYSHWGEKGCALGICMYGFMQRDEKASAFTGLSSFSGLRWILRLWEEWIWKRKDWIRKRMQSGIGKKAPPVDSISCYKSPVHLKESIALVQVHLFYCNAL